MVARNLGAVTMERIVGHGRVCIESTEFIKKIYRLNLIWKHSRRVR